MDMAKPTIRFKGYQDDWEQRKLGDVAPLRGGYAFKSSEYKKDGTPIVRISNILPDGSIGADFACYDDMENDENISLRNGDALLAMSGATTGKVSILKCKNTDKYYQNQRVGYFKRNIQYNYDFVSTIVRSDLFKEQLMSVLVAGAQPNVSSKEIDSFEFVFPLNIEEQKKIGQYFANLDTFITLHQRKCDETKRLKKYMLQKMFPQNGEKVPEIRFSGFTDDWEQRKLGDIGKARSGVGFPDAEQGGVTGIPFFKVSDMNLDGNENEMTVANNYVTAEQIAVHRWSPITELPAIFFAKVGAAVMLNRKRLCRFPFLLDNNTMAYSLSSTKWDADFAKALFGTVDLTSLVQVGALPSYNARDVESMEIYLPSLLEQEQIGGFFKQLDTLITLHQRELENLQNIKKFMLGKMFV